MTYSHMTLDDNLEFQYEDPWLYHIEVREFGSKKILFQRQGIRGWQELLLWLQDWQKSQQSNLVDIWIGSYKYIEPGKPDPRTPR